MSDVKLIIRIYIDLSLAHGNVESAESVQSVESKPEGEIQ